MAITQISLFLMNQPGQLVDAVGAISGTGSNIRAMSISEANDFGILRAIVTDTDKVCAALKEKYLITRTPVVAARMDDRHGALWPFSTRAISTLNTCMPLRAPAPRKPTWCSASTTRKPRSPCSTPSVSIPFPTKA